MSSSRRTPPSGHFHAVQFYNDDHRLCGIVAAFLAEGLHRSDPAIVIATPEHTSEIERQLAERGLDVARLRREEELTMVDADEVLSWFMEVDMPNPAAFRYRVGEIFERICDSRPECTLRAYGEMVNLLWTRGFEAAAIRVETLWNQLANSHDFQLLCSYSMGNFYKGAALEDIKAQHSHVTSAAGEHVPIQ